jgi:hypothetical protein
LILLKASFPSVISWTGMILVMAGMMLHSYVSHKGVILDGKKVSA